MADGSNYPFDNDHSLVGFIEAVDGLRFKGEFSLTEVGIGIPWSVLCDFGLFQNKKNGKFSVQESILPDFLAREFKYVVRGNVYAAPVRFKCKSAFILLKNTERLKENVLRVLERLCRTYRTHFYQCLITRKYFVCGKTKTCVDRVLPVIEQSIVEITFPIEEFDKNQADIEEFIVEGKLVQVTPKKHEVVFVATIDAQEDLVINDYCLRLPSLESETLLKNEQSNVRLMELAKSINITVVHHDKHTELLHLKGTKHRVKKFYKQVRNMFYIKAEKLTVSSLKMYDVEQSLMKTAEETNVCVELISPSRNEIGGSLIATWFYPDGRQLHLVQGNLLKLNVDTIMILSSDTHKPLAELPAHDIEYLSRFPKYDLRRNSNWVKTFFPPLYFVPVYEKKNDSNVLKAAFYNAFSEISDKRFKTVAFHSTVKWPFFPDFLSEFIFASMKYPVEVFICCSPDEDVSDVVKKINDCCLCARQGRFKMNINTYLEGFHQIDVVVEAGTIAFAKTDVLVNTTDARLTLASGAISTQIVKHAGSDILDECKQNYPYGIKEGSFAVTSSGKLAGKTKARYIFHCALPRFEKDKFDQVIQNMVKQLLVEADHMQCASIAIPLIGTGKHEYPVRETVYAMVEAAYDYAVSAIRSSLKRIVFVIYDDFFGRNIKQFSQIHDYIVQERQGRFRFDLRQSDCPGVYKEIQSDKLSAKVVILVTSTAVMKHVPLSTVVFHVSTGNVKEVCLERGSGLNIASKYSQTKDAIDKCVKETVTDIAFVFSNGNPNMLKHESEAVIEHVSRVIGKAKYLRRVIIMLSDVLFNETLKQLLATCSYLPGSAYWTVTESKDVHVAYRVCALKEKLLDKVQHYAKRIEPHMKKDLNYADSLQIPVATRVPHSRAYTRYHRKRIPNLRMKKIGLASPVPLKSRQNNENNLRESEPDVSTRPKGVPPNAAPTYSVSSQASQAAVETQHETQNTLTYTTSSQQSPSTGASQTGENIGKCHGTNRSILNKSSVTDELKQVNGTTPVSTTGSSSPTVFPASVCGNTFQGNIAGSEKSSSSSNVYRTTEQENETTKCTDTHDHSFKRLPANGMNGEDVLATSTTQIQKDEHTINSQPRTGNLTILESSTKEQKLEYEQHCELSAIINPGIINFLQTLVSSWIDSMEHLFAVKISGNKDSNYTVFGTYDRVAAFESYLENNFPG